MMDADKVLREAVALCREHGAGRVVLFGLVITRFNLCTLVDFALLIACTASLFARGMAAVRP